MPRRFVDLSIYLENDVLSDPPAFAPKVEYFTHENTYEQIQPFFPGLKKEDLPDGEGWAVEFVHLSTHNGTHLDAPYHFHSTMDRSLGDKKPATTIDQVPLEWCFQPGVKLDFRHLPDGHVVTAAEVEAELRAVIAGACTVPGTAVSVRRIMLATPLTPLPAGERTLQRHRLAQPRQRPESPGQHRPDPDIADLPAPDRHRRAALVPREGVEQRRLRERDQHRAEPALQVRRAAAAGTTTPSTAADTRSLSVPTRRTGCGRGSP